MFFLMSLWWCKCEKGQWTLDDSLVKKKKRFFPSGSKVQRVKRNHLLGAMARGVGEFWGGVFILQPEIIILGCKFGNCHRQLASTPPRWWNICRGFYRPPWATGWVCHAQSRSRWRTKSSWCAIHRGKSASGSLSLRFDEVGRVKKKTRSLPWQWRAWWGGSMGKEHGKKSQQFHPSL